jgi:hypothetical protein
MRSFRQWLIEKVPFEGIFKSGALVQNPAPPKAAPLPTKKGKSKREPRAATPEELAADKLVHDKGKQTFSKIFNWNK